MKNKNEIKTGLLVIAGIALFIFGYSYLKSNDIFVSDRTFYAVYDDVEGVVNGTPVTVNGFPVGSITDISFHKQNKLLVKFRVENKINFSKAPESRIDLINLSPSCSISVKIATASPPAAAKTDTSFERSVLFIFIGKYVREVFPNSTGFHDCIENRFGKNLSLFVIIVSLVYMTVFLIAEITAISKFFNFLNDTNNNYQISNNLNVNGNASMSNLTSTNLNQTGNFQGDFVTDPKPFGF